MVPNSSAPGIKPHQINDLKMATNYKFDFMKSQIGGFNNNGLKVTNQMETDLVIKGGLKLKMQKKQLD